MKIIPHSKILAMLVNSNWAKNAIDTAPIINTIIESKQIGRTFLCASSKDVSIDFP